MYVQLKIHYCRNLSHLLCKFHLYIFIPMDHISYSITEILNTTQQSNADVKNKVVEKWTLDLSNKIQGNDSEVSHNRSEVVGDNDVTVCNLCRIKMTLLDVRNSYNNSRLRASNIQIYFDLNTNEVKIECNLLQMIGINSKVVRK